MKKRKYFLWWLFALFLVTNSFGQITSQINAKVVTASQTISNQSGFSIIVGSPVLGGIEIGDNSSDYQIRFPWDVLYLYETFSDDAFEISKGYFSDRVRINWTIRNNTNLITHIIVSRRVLSSVEAPFRQIASLSSNATEYEDFYLEGGVLYEYMVEAFGVLNDRSERYKTYISGVGFRLPSAVVTGNVSFEGSMPVRNVSVHATPTNGSFSSTGSAAKLEKNSWLEVNYLSTPIDDKLMFQAWVKPSAPFTSSTDSAIDLFTLKSTTGLNSKVLTAKLKTQNSNDYLEINIDGSVYKVYNYIPSGALNARGDDILVPVSQFNTRYTHISAVMENNKVPVLYINGRKIEENYVAFVHQKALEVDENYEAPYFRIEKTQIINNFYLQNNEEWVHFTMGSPQTKSFIIEEARLWRGVLDDETILNDYKRYISGNDPRLVSYLRFDEGIGKIAYDYAHQSFSYNNNHAELDNSDFDTATQFVSWTSEPGDLPERDQLGFFGVTDKNGNYVINAIPYSGTGQSFEITPILGVHEFEPNQQLVYLGIDNPVANQINFTDVSSFIFRGKVYYDTRGVFSSFVDVNSFGSDTVNFQGLTDGDEYVSGPGIIDEGYNYYQKNGIQYAKGEYWLNDADTPEDDSDDYLERYARVALEGANIYIDGQIVLDSNNTPVLTDNEGNFEIRVPIGEHYITVNKDGHEFAFGGRFPADQNILAEFYEDDDQAVIFVDQTRVSLVGRVVGGTIESDKVIGFGYNGSYSHQSRDINGALQSTQISSTNNLGIASITLDYSPPSGRVTNYTKFNVKTNDETGEYRVDLLPLNYAINQTSGLRIVNNPAISLLDANEILNLNTIVELTTPTYEHEDGTMYEGVPYHYERSFVYRSTPVLRVTEQKGEDEISFDDGTRVSTEGFSHLIYRQFSNYEINLVRIESYINYDRIPEEEYIVPLVDGELNITNNAALEGSESIELDESDQSKVIYKFRGGLPSIVAPFTSSISIKYLINGVEYEAENYQNEVILLGGQSDGSQTFITAAPDIPDIILRDPPGSNSFATIESGESITFTTENDFTNSGGISTEFKLLLGVVFEGGGGLAGPVISSETTNNVSLGIGLTSSSTDGKSLTKTYTFGQSISTSADPDPDTVGALSDLYIGQSKNYFYGTYDDIDLRQESNGGSGDELQLMNIEGEALYVNKQKAVYVSEEPSDTFFVFSQRHILETLIPELEFFIESIENGALSEDDLGVLTIDEYQQQINLWRSTIRENERTKYIAKNDRTSYREELQARINDYVDEISKALSAGNDPVSERRLSSKLNASRAIQQAINNNFESNISLDAGVGELSRTVETSLVNTSSKLINLNTEQSFALELGFNLNKFGLLNTTSGFSNQDINSALTEEEENTTTISYVLSDNDLSNLLSVDVVNAFDGNGPVFSLIGGRSSCPYIAEERSVFYNHGTYNPNDEEIVELEEDEQEILSNGTQQVEVPEILVDVAKVFNVPETANAEFTLTLVNRSASESDATLVLFVVPESNQNNAEINIPEEGVIYVDMPYADPVEYQLTLGKTISDIYNYEDIEIVLASECDHTDVSASVTISAQFVPSCSKVTVSSPLENWIYNINEAYNQDGSTNNLTIELSEYDLNFDSFQKIDLQYRQISSPTWTRLQSYYSTLDFYEEAQSNNELEISLIEESKITYAWDVLGQGLQDGEYEIRAVSTCVNGTEFISESIRGRVDLSSPRVFGTPSPTDGILSYGEDVSVRFNENVFYNSAVSLVEIKGETNQLPVNNDVSISFNGIDNTAIIDNPYINTGSFAFEFWMKNSTTSANAVIVNQEEGFNIEIQGNNLVFNFGDYSARGVFANDDLFHHYTFTYDSRSGELSIYQDASVVNTSTAVVNMTYSFTNPITLGGNTFVGNIHDMRLWSKALSLTESFANIYSQYLGNEPNLVGYWPMNEGNGSIARDLARFKHMQLNSAGWDIKPKGNSYEFDGDQYLTLENVNYVNLTENMDFTLSFWLKTGGNQSATIFSNGRGDGTDVILADGTYNKWAVNLNPDGNISLDSEGVTYELTTSSITDNAWHHFAILMNRQGNLNTYVDASLVTSLPNINIKGFFSDRIWLGARGHRDAAGQISVDRNFKGKLDEIRLWNTLRTPEQITRDRYNELDEESIGLQLYLKMNQPSTPQGNGPRYYHVTNNLQTTNSLAILSSNPVNYSEDTPAIKPKRRLINFQVDRVINGDEMIFSPVVASLASIEGQVLDITVHRMFDESNNIQQSPITWTAFVNQNQVNWSIDGEKDLLSTKFASGENKILEVVLRNNGGTPQPFHIHNVPNWLSLSQVNGVLAPSSSITLQAAVDPDLGFGYFEHDLILETDFGFDQKIQLQVEVIAQAPDWDINPQDFDFSLNIIGKIKIDGVFSENINNKIAAFVNGEVRGVANLVYDEDYKSHYVFLTVHNNIVSGEEVSFNIWDSSTGIVHSATIDSMETLEFIDNNVLGTKGSPIVFENAEFIVQTLTLNNGWTWASFFVEGNDFSDINAFTDALQLQESDRILSSESSFELYSNGMWSGSLSSNDGGLKSNKMYKMRFANPNEQYLSIVGRKVDLESWNFDIQQNWNWLPYVVSRNTLLNDALANFDPAEGDVIKSQNRFAIYDVLSGWSGSLQTLEVGKGYMLRSSTDQNFSYPTYLEDALSKVKKDKTNRHQKFDKTFVQYQNNMNAVVQLPEGYNRLYVYDKEGFLRGSAATESIRDRNLSFITIYGDEAEKLTFYIDNGIKKEATTKTILYSHNDIKGSVAKPIIIEEDFDDDIHVSPNPFKDVVHVKWVAAETHDFTIRVYNILGDMVFRLESEAEKGVNNFDLNLNVSSGVYFIDIFLGDKKIIKKLIKH